MKEFLTMWQNSLNFKGKTSRRDFWMAYLFNMLFELTIIYVYVSWFPLIAMSIRRLHDIGKSGWWYLLNLIPLVGWIILLIFYCQPSVHSGDSFQHNFEQPSGRTSERTIDISKKCKYCKSTIDATESFCPYCSASQNDNSNKSLNDTKQKLDDLKRLYDNGVITQKEYEKRRAEIIADL